MTAFYMFRLVFLTFFGYSRADNHAQKHIHESPRTMTIPLMILAVLSVVGGWIGWPASLFGSNQFEKFLEPVMRSEERRVGKSVDLGGRRIIKKKKKKNERNV